MTTVVTFPNLGERAQQNKIAIGATRGTRTNLPNLKIFHKTLTTVTHIYIHHKTRLSLRRFSRNSLMLSSIMCRFSAESDIKFGNYGKWLSHDRFSPHVEMFNAEISRLTSTAQGRPSLFGSPLLLCTFLSLTVHAQNQSIILSQSTTLHQVPRYMMYYFFSFFYVRTLQLSLPATLLPSLLNFLLCFLFFSTAVSPPILLAGGLGVLAGYCCCCCCCCRQVFVCLSPVQSADSKARATLETGCPQTVLSQEHGQSETPQGKTVLS
jgi:hypothetical protein